MDTQLVKKILFTLTIAVLQAGCQRAKIEYREVKGVHEKVTETELKQYLRIIDSLPDKKLPPLPPIFRSLPSWNPDRTLPVSELVNEERKLLDQSWDVNFLAGLLKRNRPLEIALRREGITLDQFLGLTLAIGAAMSHSQLREDQDLDAIVKRGRQTVAQIGVDDRTFSKLSREARFTALRRAGWLTRVDRVNRLREVPPENLALVKQYAEQLAKVMPSYFLDNPIDVVSDLLAEQGMPFEEIADSGNDSEINWSRDNALIGYDEPDLIRKKRSEKQDVSSERQPKSKAKQPKKP